MGEHTTIQNCSVEFRKECPLKWEALAETEQQNTRICSTCERSVFFCSSNTEAIEHAKLGNCIAMKTLDGEGLPVVYLGEPQEPTPKPTATQLKLKSQYLFEQKRKEALRNSKLTKQYCPDCGFPKLSWHRVCRVCESKKPNNTKPTLS